MSAQEQDEVVVAVCGAGIAGFAFTIASGKHIAAGQSATWLRNKKVRFVMLERGAMQDGDRRTSYSHSIAMRSDFGGIPALKELGVYDELLAGVTPSRGGFLAWISGCGPMSTVTVALRAAWFMLRPDLAYVRVFRFSLWCALRATALAAGVEIRYDSEVAKVERISENSQHRMRITCKSGAVFDADLVIAADGVRSGVRQSLAPEEKLGFLNTLILGAAFKVKREDVPAFSRDHHGMVIGPKGTSVFLAEEGNGVLLFSLGFSNPVPAPRDALQHDQALRERVRTIAGYYPPQIATFILRLLDTEHEEPFVVSAQDKFPNPPLFGQVIFIGDACHPLSPYGGSGANMALTDGVRLARHLFAPSTITPNPPNPLTLAAALDNFYAERSPIHRQIISRQRRIVKVAHASSPLGVFVRNSTFTLISNLADPEKRPRTAAITLTLTALGVLYIFRHRLSGLVA